MKNIKKPKKINQKKLEKKLRNKCKKLWRELVLHRWGGMCVECTETKMASCHHILPKEMFGITRYDPRNGIVLCPTHHKWGKFSAHKNPLWFVALLNTYMTSEDLEYLKLKMCEPFIIKFNALEYQKVLDRLVTEDKELFHEESCQES